MIFEGASFAEETAVSDVCQVPIEDVLPQRHGSPQTSTYPDESGPLTSAPVEQQCIAMEDKVDAILKKLEEMEVVQVRMEQKLDALQAELDNLKKEHTKLTEENLKIKKCTIEQDERINLLEREIRKDKLIIQGIPYLENEVDSQLKEKINSMFLHMEIQFMLMDYVIDLWFVTNKNLNC
ncbi:hypothetical protein RN001_001746 [Aquatica leii]|uniref:Uncharacterized protein n=1 Tax=Aquatica leii TaxID=1421715 RepID=A0AAN7PC48_9COLE|nr:hypothetical protein RN001_001746 [Aquatica leii]